MIKARAMPVTNDAGMNKTEASYAAELEVLKLAGEISDWRFEPVRLIIANRTSYTPDFMVIGVGGEITFHEVKGFWRDDARVKIKVAAREFPWFNFIAVQKVAKKRGGGWKKEVF